jgi:ATP-dependent Clp protease ATP-binding subunit ClpC
MMNSRSEAFSVERKQTTHSGPCCDLSAEAAAKRLGDSPFGDQGIYESIFDAIQRGLRRRTARHVLLVAERGVGAAALLAEVARRAISGQLSLLAERRFLLADCRFVAADESREELARLIAPLAGEQDGVLCLDHFAALLRSRDALSKPPMLSLLSQVACRIVGVVAPHEYEEWIAGDADLSELFSVVEIPEPPLGTAISLLERFAKGLEESFDLSIDAPAIRQAAVLSANFILSDRLPGKALKVLHRACEDLEYERCCGRSARRRLTADDVVTAVAHSTGVPEGTLRGIAEQSDFARSLSEEVVGQPHVLKELTAELDLIKAGLVDPDKPASVMLFVGQTGTGKTETAKALAKFYSASKRLRTYTLGNFVEPHSVAGIIGVPPGYVGHDQGGRIVNDLNSDPYCVFLLDEADKAHPDVLQPLLNLFDEGWIRDQRGMTGYADKSIFILTTNVGQRMIADMHKQGKTPEEIAVRMKEALAQIRHGKSNRPVFAPEFLARIKRVLVFNPLDQAAMEGICRKLYAQMQRAWHEKRGKTLVVADELLQHIAVKAYEQDQKAQGREGGRVVRKLMSLWIDLPVQRKTAARPDEYRAAESVEVGLDPMHSDADGGSGEGAQIVVRFRPPSCADRPTQEEEHVA